MLKHWDTFGRHCSSRLQAGEKETEEVRRKMELLKNDNEKLISDKDTVNAECTVSSCSDVADVY